MNITLLEMNGNFSDNDLLLMLSMFTGGAGTYTSGFQFLVNNYEALKAKLATKPEIWNSLVYTTTSQFKTTAGYQAVNDFYLKHKEDFGPEIKIVEKSLKRIQRMVDWTEENIPSMVKWLDENLSQKYKDMTSEMQDYTILENSLTQTTTEAPSTTEVTSTS